VVTRSFCIQRWQYYPRSFGNRGDRHFIATHPGPKCLTPSTGQGIFIFEGIAPRLKIYIHRNTAGREVIPAKRTWKVGSAKEFFIDSPEN